MRHQDTIAKDAWTICSGANWTAEDAKAERDDSKRLWLDIGIKAAVLDSVSGVAGVLPQVGSGTWQHSYLLLPPRDQSVRWGRHRGRHLQLHQQWEMICDKFVIHYSNIILFALHKIKLFLNVRVFTVYVI